MHTLPKLLVIAFATALAACSVDEIIFELPLVTVGGAVTGLDGTGLVLSNNGGDDLAISGNGEFAFTTSIQFGTSYALTVKTQPSNPVQVCSVSNGTGIAGNGDVKNVQVSCSTTAFRIGGTVTGLSGSGLMIQNNGGDNLPISADGSFTFTSPIASGAIFAVTVLTQPDRPSQTCTVAGGAGTVGSADVTSIAINCTTNGYLIGGTINGLLGTVTLQNNGGDNLDITSNGTFAFATPVPSGATYAVTVLTQPATPSQTCVVTEGSGSVTNTDVTSVVVTCTTDRFRIGGTLLGLATGNSITLRNNGGDDLIQSMNGSFTFATSVPSGQPYAVAVVANPTSPISQSCVISNATGIVGGADIIDVEVTCTTNAFTIGGSVSGLTGAGLVLRNNGTDDLSITENGGFTFAAPIASGAIYAVTVETQPAGQICSVSAGAGTVGENNVTEVRVTCESVDWSTALFPIAVPSTTLGLGDLVLDNNGNLLVSTNSGRSIVRVNRVTGAQTTIATGIGSGSLLGLTYRAANDLIYASTQTQIFAVTPAGAVTPLASGFTQLNAITIAPPAFGAFGGFLIGVTNGGTVLAVDPSNGAVTTLTTAAEAASDLAFAPDGTLYICGGATVRTVTAAGTVTTFATGLFSADGITITPDGARMFIADSGQDLVVQVTIPGAVVTSFATADIDDGFFVGGILAAAGNTLIVMTGESSLTLIGLTY